MQRSGFAVPCGRIGKPACGGGRRGAHHLAPFFARPSHHQHPFASAYESRSPWGADTANEPSFAFPGFGFGPRDLMRQMEDITSFFNDFNPAQRRGAEGEAARQQPTWNPRFDVQESNEAYELRGELPGVESKDLDVRFVDPRTLVIKGETTTEKASGRVNPEAASLASSATVAPENAPVEAAKEEDDDDARSMHSQSSTSSYVQPTVEDAAEEGGVNVDANANAHATASGPSAEEKGKQRATEKTDQEVAENAEVPAQPRYWISERSTGSFQRTFRFAGKVDQDSVTAGLKNGILSVRAPKLQEKKPEQKKIVVE